jgi:hypothetical protein
MRLQRASPVKSSSSAIFAAIMLVWGASVAAGLWALWAYDNRPGPGAEAHDQWPATAALARAEDRATLVLIAHPQCTCTRASLTELSEILVRAHGRPKTYVVFLKPHGVVNGWEQTDLWQTATRLPDTIAIRDDGGDLAGVFGAETSGQTFLYDARGTLQFSGGITGARAHAGENAGRAQVVALLNRLAVSPQAPTPVFGCPLFRAES